MDFELETFRFLQKVKFAIPKEKLKKSTVVKINCELKNEKKFRNYNYNLFKFATSKIYV